MNLLASALGFDLVVVLLLKGGLLAGALLLAARALGRREPGLRSTVWAAGGAVLLALPALAVAAPPLWSAPLVPLSPGWADPSGEGVSLAGWLLLGWAAGATVVFGRFLLGLVRTWRATGRSEPCRDERLLSLAEEARRRSGVRRAVRLSLQEGRTVPATWGALRPRILLPSAAVAWPDVRLRAVLHHEMVHVRRHDFAALLIQEAVRAVYWFNPLVWLLLARHRSDQEITCDDAVVRESMGAAEYARQLVAVARFALPGPRPPEAALPLARRVTLAGRVRFVMDGAGARRAHGRRLAVALVLLVFALGVPLGRTSVLTCSSGPVSQAAATADAAPAIPPPIPLPLQT